MSLRRLMMASQSAKEYWDPDYAKLEYIECNFNSASNLNIAMIDTELLISSSYHIYWKGMFTNARRGSSSAATFPGRARRIFGQFSNTGMPVPRIVCQAECSANSTSYNSSFQIRNINGAGVQVALTDSLPVNSIVEVEMKDDAWYYNGVKKGTNGAGAFTDSEVTTNLFLGGAHGGTSINNQLFNYCFEGRHYAFKVWDENGDLVLDFRPAMRIDDGMVGMYDMVSMVFYEPYDLIGVGNVRSCEFTAGPEIE